MKLTALVIVHDLAIGAYLSALLSEDFKKINVIEKNFKDVRPIDKILKYSPDIIFCEIDHFDSDSFELVTTIPIEKSNLIFLLKAENPALKAIQFSNLHYLIKPFSPGELKMVMEKVLRSIKEKSRSNSLQKNGKLSLSTHKGYTLVEFTNIAYINSSGNYCTVFFNDGEKITLTKLIGEFEQTLPEGNFIRIHQSFIVNISYISEVVNDDGLEVVLDSGMRIPVSRRRKKQLFKILGI